MPPLVDDLRSPSPPLVLSRHQTGPRVIVIGPTQAAVDAAREMLEFVVERVPVEPEQIGWLIGKGGKNFKELQEKTKVGPRHASRRPFRAILPRLFIRRLSHP